MGLLSWIIRWIQCNDKGPYKEKREAGRSIRVREGFEDAMVLILKMEEGAMSQGMQECIRQGNGVSPRASGRSLALLTP